MSFITGYNILIIENEKAKLDVKDVAGVYKDIVTGSRTQARQEGKISADVMALFQLDESKKYFIVIRRRIGENAETQRVRLCEFGLEGLYEPVFTSRFVMWNHQDAQEVRGIIVEMQNGIRIDDYGEE